MNFTSRVESNRTFFGPIRFDRIEQPLGSTRFDSIGALVSREHEAIHTFIMGNITGQLMAMGLLLGLDFELLGGAKYAHRLNLDSEKQGNSSIGPAIPDPWPATVIEAGWSEGVGRLRVDVSWWLSAKLPRLVVLIPFKRSFP